MDSGQIEKDVQEFLKRGGSIKQEDIKVRDLEELTEVNRKLIRYESKYHTSSNTKSKKERELRRQEAKELFIKGFTKREIASKMGLGYHTIYKYLKD